MQMPQRISLNMWESKKDMIIKLYEKDEWPVKQVIKKIRSHDFNPSESQLRSRLKKWRVTKSSRRQGRGKGVDRSANHTTEASSEDHSGGESTQSKATPDQNMSREELETRHAPRTAPVKIPHPCGHSHPEVLSTCRPFELPHNPFPVASANSIADHYTPYGKAPTIEPDSFQWMADPSHWLPLESRTQSFAAPLQAPVPFSPPIYQQMPVIPRHIRSDWHPTPERLPDTPVSGLYFMGYPAW